MYICDLSCSGDRDTFYVMDSTHLMSWILGVVLCFRLISECRYLLASYLRMPISISCLSPDISILFYEPTCHVERMRTMLTHKLCCLFGSSHSRGALHFTFCKGLWQHEQAARPSYNHEEYVMYALQDMTYCMYVIL